MLGRLYTCVVEAATYANASGDYDLFEVTPADDKPILFVGLTIDNVGGTADAGDAQEELIRVAIVRGNTTSGSGGNAATNGAKVGWGGAGIGTSGFTFESMNTTPASTGGTTIWAGGWNVRVPFREFWPEELCIGASQADTLMCVRLASTVADDLTISATLWVAELGG